MKKHERKAIQNYLQKEEKDHDPVGFLWHIHGCIREKSDRMSWVNFRGSLIRQVKADMERTVLWVVDEIEKEIKKEKKKEEDAYTARVEELEEYLGDLLEEHDSGQASSIGAAKHLVDKYWPELKKAKQKKK